MLVKKNKALIIIVLLQIIFFGTWFILEANKLSDPKSKIITVKTIPVDPRDPISGKYIILNYEFSNGWRFKNRETHLGKKQGQEIYAVLTQKDGLFVPDYISFEKPKIKDEQAAIRGTVNQYGRIEYGIEQYFINEALKEPNARIDNIEAILVIDDDFNPTIKSVMVNGVEFK